MTGKWILPSLNRPHLLKEFFEAYKKSKGSTPGLVLIDKGDFIANQQKYQELELPEGWSIQETNGVTMGDKVRETWDQIKDLDWVGILNDDHKPITEEWDKKIVGQINGFNVIGTNDGPSPDKPWQCTTKLAGGICYSGKILRAVGYMFPEGIHHLYHDDVWGLLVSKAGCGQVLMDVCVHHDHAYKDETKKDSTFEKINSEESWKNSKGAYDKWLREHAAADLQKIIGILPKMGVMIATPSHDANCSLDFGVGLMDGATAMNGANVYFEFARVDGSSLVPHARNSLVSMFLKSKCQRLLFIDSDQGFNRNHIFALLQTNRKIVAGVVLHKRFPHNLNFEPLKEDEKYFQSQCNKHETEMFKMVEDKKEHVFEVNRAGTGFMMIDRSVFDILAEDPKILRYKAFDDNDDVYHHEFFKMGAEKEGGRYHGEDWYFCEAAQRNNIPVHVNSHVCIPHKGSFTWRIDESQRKI